MRTALNAGATGALGAAVTVGIASPVPPAAAVAGGALLTAIVHWSTLARRDFRLAGTVYALVAAAGLASVEGLPPVVRWSVFPSLLWFGLCSLLLVAAFVLVRVVSRTVARRFVPEDVAESIADFVSALASAALLLWTLLQTQERLVRTGGVATLGTVGLAADLLGYRLPFDAGFLRHAIDVQVVVFVGAVIVGFHTLASWEAAWRVAGETADAGRGATTVADDDVDPSVRPRD
jgi:hypothetical protein